MPGIREEIAKLRSEIGYKKMATADNQNKKKYESRATTQTRTYDEYLADLEKAKAAKNNLKTNNN